MEGGICLFDAADQVWRESNKISPRYSHLKKIVALPGKNVNCINYAALLELVCGGSCVNVGTRLLVTCRHSEPSFFWSGGCKRQVKMEGRCTHSLPVFANLCWPAVYNLNTVRVLAAVCGGGSSYHVQRWHRTSHMTVHGVVQGTGGGGGEGGSNCKLR